MENLPEIQITNSPSGKTKYYNVVFESGRVISCRSHKQAKELVLEFQSVLQRQQKISTSEPRFDSCSSDNEPDRTGDSWRSAYQEASSSLSGIRDSQRRSDYNQRDLGKSIRATNDSAQSSIRATSESIQSSIRATSESIQSSFQQAIDQVRTIGKIIEASSAINCEMAQTVTELAHVWHQSKTGSSDRLFRVQQQIEPTTINVAVTSATDTDVKT